MIQSFLVKACHAAVTFLDKKIPLILDPVSKKQGKRFLQAQCLSFSVDSNDRSNVLCVLKIGAHFLICSPIFLAENNAWYDTFFSFDTDYARLYQR